MRTFTIALISCILLAQSAVAQEYTVKPGDIITVTVWERQTLSGVVTVGSDGYITLPPPIGNVRVSGLTVKSITDLITECLKEYIKNPTVFVSVRPAEGFTIHVIGEVNSPNFIIVPEGTSLQEAITRAGGLTELADLNHIRLMRKEKVVNQLRPDAEQKENGHERSSVTETIIDFSQFIAKTDLTANPTLKADDVIIIPRLSMAERAAQTVTVIGAVARAGTFNIEKPLPLIEVLKLAGGASDVADLQNLSILRFSDGKYSWQKVNFKGFLAGNELAANPNISPGETVFVPRIERKEERTFLVNVVGQTVKPGAYPVTDETRLFDAIFMADGFADDAAIDKITIIHQSPKSPVKTEVNVRNYLLSGDEKYNPLLAKGDTIFIPISEDAKKIPLINTPFSPSIRVTIIGEVTTPDTYQVSTEVSVLDILKLAGGPASEADLKRVTIIRAKPEKEQRLKIDLEQVLTEGEFKLLPPLLADDTIFVPKLKPEKRIWRTFMQIVADFSTLVLLYLIITGRR
jgi:protein involved in polysaccharide export with SLBB domain